MSPRRGDRVTVPPPAGQWEVRFGTSAATAGWEELCRHALPNTTAMAAAPAAMDLLSLLESICELLLRMPQI